MVPSAPRPKVIFSICFHTLLKETTIGFFKTSPLDLNCLKTGVSSTKNLIIKPIPTKATPTRKATLQPQASNAAGPTVTVIYIK